MELNRIEELISELPAEQRSAILKLIDLKTEQDMKELIKSNEILKTSIDSLKENINHIESKNDSKFNMLFWALGVMITIMIALKFFT